MNFATLETGFRRRKLRDRAFTLIEVTIAAGILFMCLFAILALLANTLHNARALQRPNEGAMLGKLASEASLNQKIEEGNDSGDFQDFGDAFADYRWSSETNEVGTNGLFEVDFTVHHQGTDAQDSHMAILLYSPNSTRTFGGFGRRPRRR